MSGWLLDTNVIAEVLRPTGSTRVKAWLERQDEWTVHLSILTIAEYDKGIANVADDDPRRTEFVRVRDGLIERFRPRLLGLPDAVVRRWGTISGEIKRRTRQSPPAIDTLLAATAIEHGLRLATRNIADFALSGAVIFNPWSDDPEPALRGSGSSRRTVP